MFIRYLNEVVCPMQEYKALEGKTFHVHGYTQLEYFQLVEYIEL